MRRPPSARTRRDRSSLAAVRGHRGQTAVTGDPERGRVLAAALARGSSEDTRSLTHGFHTFPGRMHPAIARALVAASRPGDVILDPFCGGGTVLVEAVAAGHAAIGVDASPLAVRLARCKSAVWGEPSRRRLVERARRLAARAAERARAARGERLPGFDPTRFAPHVFREIHLLREGIEEERDAALAEALRLVLSSILVKVSERRSETAPSRAPTRLAPGFSARLFAHKAEELARGLEELARVVPPGTPPARVIEGDARTLPALGIAPPVHLVLSSPPYPGVYDYAEHHALRAAILGIDASSHAAREIGARRSARVAGARARWQKDLEAVLAGIAGLLAEDGTVVLLCGDGVLEDAAVRADESVAAAAKPAGLAVQATAWQARPAFSAEERRVLGKDKREVLIALTRARSSAGSTAHPSAR